MDEIIKDGESPEKDFRTRRIIVSVILLTCGVAGFWVNRRRVYSADTYSIGLAFHTSIGLVFAIYTAAVKEDPFEKYPAFKEIPRHKWVALILSLIVGLINWFALEHKLY
jgi:hypothetical protein